MISCLRVLTGKRALKYGLIDGIGELTSVMQERYGDKIVLSYRRTKIMADRAAGRQAGPRVDVKVSGEFFAAVDERTTRYGYEFISLS